MTTFRSEKQLEHLRKMREKRPADWQNKAGAPTKELDVKNYRREHPDATKYQCRMDLHISPNTVSKWWNS